MMLLGALLLLAAADAGPPPEQVEQEARPTVRYSLSRPTPPAELRAFNPDRPNVTESPYTVDPGHVQLELSAAEYTLGRDRSRTLDVAPVEIRVGVLHQLELELFFTPYQRVRGDDGVEAGIGDETLLRFKVNLQGNDGDGVALGIIPYIKVPTGTGGLSNGHVEGGLIFPVAVDLPGDFNLGTMIEADLVYHDDQHQYGIDLVHTASLGHSIAGPLSGYIEYVGIVREGAGGGRAGAYQAIASTGFTWLLEENVMLDAGTRIGFSGDADRATIFLGATTRF
jgi:hypothetical protein